MFPLGYQTLILLLAEVIFNLAFFSWQKWMTRPLGQRIEFVPVNISGMPKAGSKLRLQLLMLIKG